MIRIFANSILVYVALLLLMRVIGKRQLGELELSELVVTILISEVASRPLVDEDASLLWALVPILGLLGMEFFISVLSVKSVRFRMLAAGRPALLVVRGRIDQGQMRKNRITPDELTEALRGEGILDLNDVEYAVLETNGRISVIPAPGQRTVTAAQLGLDAPDAGYPVTVVNCGRVMSENLRILGRDERWLQKTLREHGLSSPREVYLMTADMSGGIFLAPRE